MAKVHPVLVLKLISTISWSCFLGTSVFVCKYIRMKPILAKCIMEYSRNETEVDHEMLSIPNKMQQKHVAFKPS